jgi:hypothetical protein
MQQREMLYALLVIVLLAATSDALLTRTFARHTRVSTTCSIPHKEALFGPQARHISTRMSVSSTKEVQSSQPVGLRRFGALFRKFLMAMFGFGALGVARAHAAGASSVKAVAQAISKNIYGWDSVGRVPYDDYLFSTWALTDPNLLKRTIIEEVHTMMHWHWLINAAQSNTE